MSLKKKYCKSRAFFLKRKKRRLKTNAQKTAGVKLSWAFAKSFEVEVSGMKQITKTETSPPINFLCVLEQQAIQKQDVI